MVPTNYRQILEPQFEKANPQAQFLTDFAAFQSECANFQAQSAKYLYDNPDADQGIYRVHCAWLARLIAKGQNMLHQSFQAHLQGVESQTQLLQNQVDGFIATLHDWHGAPGSHVDEPPCFKQAMDEARSGGVSSGTV